MDPNSRPDDVGPNDGAQDSLANDVEKQTLQDESRMSTKDGTLLEIFEPVKEKGNGDDTEYPRGLKLFLICLSLTIIANAIPKITDEFHSLGDVGWYDSAFLITSCALMLIFGKIYTFYSVKWVYLLAIGIFEIGSAVCGAAPNSTAFIVGRAIAGLGAAGLFSGGVIILVHTVPLARRPIFQGIFAAVFGISSIAGPLLGGALTDHVSWRWCFYINLPIGGATILALFSMLHIPTPPNQAIANLPLRQQLLRLDPIGTSLFLPGCICLLLALQWGGSQYAWRDARIISLLVLAVVLLGFFVAAQMLQPEPRVTVPPRFFRQRSVVAAFYCSICTGASMLVLVYYLPIWFQAIKNVSAIQSGIHLLPLILSMVIGSSTAGAITFRVGYYTPSIIASSCLVSIGAGLISTFDVNTPISHWIGYQVIYGFGLGLSMMQPNMAVQTVLTKKGVPMASALVFFGQTFGGAIFISVAQNVFSNELRNGLMSAKGLPTESRRLQLVNRIVNTGATEVRDVVPENLLGPMLQAFNGALMKAIYVSLSVGCVGIIGGLTMEWKSVKKGEGQGEKDKKGQGEKGETPVLGEGGVDEGKGKGDH